MTNDDHMKKLMEGLIINSLPDMRDSRKPYDVMRFERSYAGGARSLWKEVNIFSTIISAEET